MTGGPAGDYGPESYTYDASTGSLASKAGVSYTYGDTLHKHAVTGLSNGSSFSYDANGSMITRTVGGQTFNLSYNAENRMTGVTGAATASFVYDDTGARVIATEGVTTTVYVGSYFEWHGTITDTVKYYYAGTVRVAMRKGDETHPGFTRWRRKLMRRLRMTEYGKRGGASKEGSISGLEMIYTGGFEANDMFHTMAGALEGLEALFHRYDGNANWIPAELRQKLKLRDSRVLSESELALIRALFNAEHRTRMVEDAKFKKEQVALHKQQLQDGIYPKGIQMFFEKGLINAAGRDALLAAFDIDQKLEDYGSLTPGIGGFLINFLTLAQKALNESRLKSYRLDRKDMGKPGEGAVLDERSDNGASGETVGTHTLLAKDTPKSQPLYEDANALAKFASLAAATILMNSVNDLPDPNIGQDWEAILRHYLRFPRALPGMWEQQVLEHVRNTGENPRFDQITDAPRFPPLTLTPGGRLEALRAGKKRVELEALYIALEKKADSYMLLNIIPG